MKREVWDSTDDRGVKRHLVIDYDERDVTEISREGMHELLHLAGLRQSFEVEGALLPGCSCGHGWEYHGPELPGCAECRCRKVGGAA